MKVIRVSEHIWCLKTWLGIQIRVWAVAGKDGITLVDAGIPIMKKGILQFVKQLQAGPLRRIVLTHGHADHVGAINGILKWHDVPVFAHSIELPYMEGEAPYPRRKKASAFVQKGIVLPLECDGTGRLMPIGGLTPYLAPGHSPGHVVYYHEQDRVMLAGDLFTSKKGKLNRPMPMFTANMQEAVQSSSIVERLKPEHLEICHGNPVLRPADQLPQYWASMAM